MLVPEHLRRPRGHATGQVGAIMSGLIGAIGIARLLGNETLAKSVLAQTQQSIPQSIRPLPPALLA